MSSEALPEDRSYRSLFDNNYDAVLLSLPDGTITDANRAACDLFGLTREEICRRGRAGLLVEDAAARAAIEERQRTGRVRARLTYVRGDGTLFVGDTTSAADTDKTGRCRSFVIVRDISEGLQTELERDITVQFLHTAHSCTDLTHLVRSSAALLQERSGCEAVGIRLEEGGDYPYFEARGFPPGFIAAERSLCARDELGAIVRDSVGNPVLECMCGNVIRGRFDPSRPFFTPCGSFWTNSTSELLARTTEADRQARTRNRCNGEGYESVALIPIVFGEERFGLLQLNDRRTGRFTPGRIALWERIAGYLAVAIARLRSQERLKASEERHRRIVETAHEGIWAMDGGHLTTFVNRHMAAMLGYAPEEMIGRRVDAFMFEADLIDHREKMAARGQGEGGVYERRFRRKDGSELWTIVSATALKDADGRFAGSFAMFTDITERKRSDQAVSHSHALLRYIIEHNRSAVAVHDRELRYIYVSQRYLDEYRVRDRNVIGKHHYEVFPDLPQKWRDVHQRALAGEVLRGEDDPYERADGTVDWTRWECRPWYEADGTIGGIIVYTEVVTQRKEAEKKIRDSEERHRRLVEAMTDAILIHSNGIVIYANPAALRLFRAAAPEPLLGRPYIDLVHPDDRAASAVRLRRNQDQGLIAPPREHRVVALDGEVIDVESIGVPFQYQGETHTFGVFRDITQRRRSEREKETLEAQLRQAQKMEAIGTLAGGIAHDFNNLLGIIMGNAEMLTLRSSTAADVKENVDPILAAARRAKHLVGQILTFSRQGEQQKLLISLKAIVKETVQFLRSSLPATIQLRYHISPDVGAIMADPTQMQQVLMNLCTNAAHAMEGSGGLLTLTLANETVAEDDPRLGVGARPGSYVRLSVTDTGHGMTPLVQARVFDPYFTTKGPGKGTGLGLSVVHGIVSAHGGMIRLESALGRGSTFHVYFPRVHEAARSKTAEPGTLPRGTERVLLVDDEPALADICRRMLCFLGYEVEVRTSPAEAFELFQADPQRYRLVMTDMTMPHLTGLGLARKLLGLRPDLPVIICTGFSDKIDERTCTSAGVGALLLKPLVLTDLAQAVRKALDGKTGL